MPESGAATCGRTLEMGFAFPRGYDPELSDIEVWTIQCGYLESTLKLLVDKRASPTTRRDVINWVATPLVCKDKLGDLPAAAFQSCCYAENVSAETMQESVLRRFAPSRLAELGYEL